MTDYTKLLAKIVPKADGEDVVRWRTGKVDSVNSNGTVNVAISGLVVPSVPQLMHVGAVAGELVHVASYRGALIIIGVVSTNARAVWTNITAQCTSLSSTTITEVQVTRSGPVAGIWARITTGVAITVPADGNIGNTSLLRLPTAWWTSLNHQQCIGGTGGNGQIANFVTDPANGDIIITAVSGGAMLPSSTTFDISGTYFL